MMLGNIPEWRDRKLDPILEKSRKYVPPKEDVLKTILVADPDTQDYLWTILLTAGRVSEINGLTWDDVKLKQRSVVLWTRKTRGGNRVLLKLEEFE